MSSLQKFENKFISYQTSDLVNSYIVNATKELKKIHKSCNFDESVKLKKSHYKSSRWGNLLKNSPIACGYEH